VAENYSKVLAYKDEYEVARQLTSDQFRQQLDAQFEGDFELEFNLAPPLLSKINPATGRPRKRKFAAKKVLPLLGRLAKLRNLRGTPLDIFGYTADRRLERRLIAEYERDIDAILSNLTKSTYDDACVLATLPTSIRGYGPVKEAAYEKTQPQRQQLLNRIAGSEQNTADLQEVGA